MKRNRNSYQESNYRQDTKTGHIIIDVALDDYLDFFHEWDNAVFRKRDMHPELANFLDLCSADIPIRKKMKIVFWIKEQNRDEEAERQIRASYLNYYRFLERVEQKGIRKNFEQALILVFISFGLILVQVLLKKPLDETIWSQAFLEGLLIGGWVFMWEALHLMFFESRGPIRRKREIQRFIRAGIEFMLESEQNRPN